MRSDTEVRHDGVKALTQVLGMVDAERFIALINRKTFDYTQWSEAQCVEQSVSDLASQEGKLREKE